MSSPTPQVLDQYTNVTLTTLAGGAGGVGSPLNSGDLTLHLPTGIGSFYPATTLGSFSVRLGINLPGLYEIVKCSVRSTDTLTILRAQEGTTARTWPVGTPVENVLSAGTVLNIQAATTQVYNVKAFGATGNGVTDDTTAIQAALNAANTSGMGIVYFPPGTYITQTLQIYSNIHMHGAGKLVSIIQLKTGTNADLLWGGSSNQALISAGATISSAGDGGLSYFGLHDLTLNGNASNNQGGTSYCVELYGYGWCFENVEIAKGFSGGIRMDWHGVESDIGIGTLVESHAINVTVHDCWAIGWQHYGPTDCEFVNCRVGNNGGHNYYQGPNAFATQIENCHYWAPGATGSSPDPHAVGMLLESNALISNTEAEGGATASMVILANSTTVKGGRYFGTGNTQMGIQLGQQAGQTPYTGQTFVSGGLTIGVSPAYCDIDTDIIDCNLGTHGGYWFANSGGFNTFRGEVVAIATTGTGSLYTGGLATTDTLDVQAAGLSGANSTFGVTQLGKQLALRVTGSVNSLSNGGTIASGPFTVNRVTTSGNVTGMILQVGFISGQIMAIENQSANSITFAIAATSHVSNGTAIVINGGFAAWFIYDTGTALWYKFA